MKIVHSEATIDESIRLYRILGFNIVKMTFPDGTKAMSIGFAGTLDQAMEEAQADFKEEFGIWCRMAPAASLIGYGVMLQRDLDLRHEVPDDYDVQADTLIAVDRLPVVAAALSERGIHLNWRAFA